VRRVRAISATDNPNENPGSFINKKNKQAEYKEYLEQ
jgi:hypothetical protein